MASASNLQETTAESQAAVLSQLSGSKLWRCTLCNREMQDASKADHLAGKAHARKLKLVGPLSPIVPSHPSSTVVSGTTVVPKAKPKKRQTANTTDNPLPTSWTCPSCDDVFSMKQKASHSCAGSVPKSSPLDNFFRSYPSFRYNASTPPATSFNFLRNHLAKIHKWPRESSERERLWELYQDVITEEFNLLFGVQDDLDAWHLLCRAVRVEPLPTTCKECRSVSTLKLFYPFKRNMQSTKLLVNSPSAAVMLISSILSNGAVTMTNTSGFSAQ